MDLTYAQIQKIKKIIEENMSVVMKLTVGGVQPPERLIKKLNLPKNLEGLAVQAYNYGKAGVNKGQPLGNVAPDDVRKLINALKLNTRQKKSIEYIKVKAQTNIDTLTNRITSGVLNAVLADQLGMYQAVKQVIPAAVATHADRYQVVQKLREMTGDWERDWHRVAHTEMWDAKVMGEANAILDGESPLSSKKGDTMVFKRPGPNACNKCKQLYLEADGITPKVFKLSDMQAFGTNYGLKQAQWKPVLGVVHPNCMCPLSVMPDGFHFDARGQLEMD